MPPIFWAALFGNYLPWPISAMPFTRGQVRMEREVVSSLNNGGLVPFGAADALAEPSL